MCVSTCVRVCVHVCVCVEKGKRKKNMFDGLFMFQSFSTSIFFLRQKCFIKKKLALEMIMIDNFCFN